MFCIDFHVTSEAFREKADAEIIRILIATANKVAKGRRSGTIVDRNGNTIGDWVWTAQRKG